MQGIQEEEEGKAGVSGEGRSAREWGGREVAGSVQGEEAGSMQGQGGGLKKGRTWLVCRNFSSRAARAARWCLIWSGPTHCNARAASANYEESREGGVGKEDRGQGSEFRGRER